MVGEVRGEKCFLEKFSDGSKRGCNRGWRLPKK